MKENYNVSEKFAIIIWNSLTSGYIFLHFGLIKIFHVDL